MSETKRLLDKWKTRRRASTAMPTAARALADARRKHSVAAGIKEELAELAAALEADFAAPTEAEFFAGLSEDMGATEEEHFDVADYSSTKLSVEKQRQLASRILCRAEGLDPDKRTGDESEATTEPGRDLPADDLSSAFDRSTPQQVDAGPKTL